MYYRGYEVNVENIEDGADAAGSRKYSAGSGADSATSRIIVNGVRDFSPVHTFECGQCFRWNKQPDGSYTGVVRGRVANVAYVPGESNAPGVTDTPGASSTLGASNMPGRLVLENVTLEEFKDIWFDYFDLERDYAFIKKAVTIDPIMEKAVEFGSGIRILQQEPWEVLISFILSSNNRIPRIMKIIEDIARLYGSSLWYEENEYFSFPDAAGLASCSLEQIQMCRAGYRCGYIHDTSKAAAMGEFNPERLAVMTTDDARKALLRFKGVGNKVADCVLLYSGIKRDVFPTDVWVKRVMEELYFRREASFGEIGQFAAEHFGEYAGIAQQYLFYYAREQKIGS